MRCENCKHWKPLEYEVYSDQPSKDDPTNWGACGRIGNGEYCGDERTASSVIAYTQDASEFWSTLITRREFGCVEFQQDYEPSELQEGGVL